MIDFAAKIEPEVVVIPYRPRSWQLNCHQNLKRFSVVVWHRRAGKTVTAINALISAALRSDKPHSRYGYVAPFKNQAVDIAWPYLRQFTAGIPDVVVKEIDKSVTLPNGAVIKIYGADNPDALRGGYFDGVVLDEVGDMKPQVWEEIIRPMLADRLGWALFIGTPKGVNMFSELYYKACNDPDWHAELLTVYDTDALSPIEVEQLRREMSESRFRQEFMCDFNAANDDQLISLELATDATKRVVLPREYELAPRIIGVDVARYGGDKCIIARRQGLMAHPLIKFQGIDNMEFAGHVAYHIQQFRPDAVFIDNGRGEGVIDRLRQLGFDIVGVDFGGASANTAYFNKRAEMWANLSQWLKDGGAIPNDKGLVMALCAPSVDFKHPSGKMRLESKDSMRERGLSSPDEGDGLALTFAHPVAPTTFRNTREVLDHGLQSGTGRSLTDYDPFDASRY